MNAKIISMEEFKTRKHIRKSLEKEDVFVKSDKEDNLNIKRAEGFEQDVEYEKILLETRYYSLGQMNAVRDWVNNNMVSNREQKEVIADVFISFCLIEKEVKRYLVNGAVDPVLFTTA